MLAILPKLAPWPFARASGTAARKATRQAPLFGYALTSAAQTPEFTVTDTYHNSTTEAGWSAFDADGSTSWYPHSQYANNYLQIECAKPRTVQSFYAFQDTAKGLHSGYLATTIRIMVSNDGVNYTQLTNSTMTYAYDAVDKTVYVSQKVSFAAPKPYKFYRIYIAPTNHPFVALAGLVLQEPLAQPLQGLVAQYRFIDKEAINEINEAFANLTGTFSVADGKLTTASNNTSYASMPKILFDEGEDFCIKLRHTFTATSQENPILGVWGSGDNSASIAWILWRNGTNSGSDRKVGFGMNTAGANGLRMSTLASVPDNQEVEIEVSRVNGIVYLLLDGVLQSSQAYTLGNAPGVGLPDMRTDVYGLVGESPRGGYYNGGQKSALQIYKGKGGHTATYTKIDALETITTPTYSSDEQDSVVANVALRRDNAVNEVNDLYVTQAAVNVQRGRLNHPSPNPSAMANIVMDRFGDGDFTIELKVNIDGVGNSGATLLGEWFRSDQLNTNNRWCVFVDQNRQLAFYVGKIDGTGVVLTLLGTTLTLGADYHIVVERVNGVVSLLLNGNEVATANFTGQIPGFAPYIARTNSTSGLHSWSGKAWDIRIAKKALYNGVVKRTAVLPKASRSRAVYTADEAKAIVLQYDFVGAREEKLGLFPSLNGQGTLAASALLINNALTTAQHPSAQFSLPVESDWAAGDFTIEMTIALNGMGQTIDTSNPLICQWPGGSNHGWSLHVRGTTRQLGFSASSDGTTVADKVAQTGWLTKTLDIGRDYHIVIERIGTTLNLFVDGASLGAIGVTTMFGSTAPITNFFGADTSRYCAVTLRRFRIARKALFNGKIVNAKSWPRFDRKNKRVHMTSGQISTTANGSNFNVYGIAQNLMYQTPAISTGSVSDTLFRTLDGKTKRLAALFAQTTSPQYTILFDKDASVAPTDDMPLYSRVLSLNGVTHDLANITLVPVAEGFGATGKAWQSVAGFWPFIYNGRVESFEFLPPAIITIGSVTLPSNVVFKGYMNGLTDVADAGSISNDLVIDVSNPRACKLYKIRGIWTQSNNYLCIGLETLATDTYANLEKLYPDIINIPRFGPKLFSGDNVAVQFSSATTLNQTPAGKPPYVQYYWTTSAATINALNAGATINHYIG